MVTSDVGMGSPGAPPLQRSSKARARYRDPFPLGVAMQAVAIFTGVGASMRGSLPPGTLLYSHGASALTALPLYPFQRSYRLVKKTANFILLQRAKSSPETAALLKSLGFSLAGNK